MTLNDHIKALEGNQKIKIGCTGGSGYFYTGTVAQLDLVRLNSDLFARAALALQEAIKTWVCARGWSKTRLKFQTGTYKKRKKEFAEYVSLGKREVLEIRDSIAEKDVMIIMVGGVEGGKDWTVSRETAINLNYEQGMVNLATAIYKTGTDHLVHLIESVKKECEYLETDPYGILENPDAIIEACRTRAGLSKVVRAMIKEPGKRVRFGMVRTEQHGLSDVVGDYVEVAPLMGDIVIAQDMYAYSSGKPYNCQIGDVLYYGTIVFLETQDGIMQDVSKKNENIIRVMIKGDGK